MTLIKYSIDLQNIFSTACHHMMVTMETAWTSNLHKPSWALVKRRKRNGRSVIAITGTKMNLVGTGTKVTGTGLDLTTGAPLTDTPGKKGNTGI